MMVKFRNIAGSPVRNEATVTPQVIENMARVTGLEPATSGVTGRVFSERKQRLFRKQHRRNDATAADPTPSGFGTLGLRLIQEAASEEAALSPSNPV